MDVSRGIVRCFSLLTFSGIERLLKHHNNRKTLDINDLDDFTTENSAKHIASLASERELHQDKQANTSETKLWKRLVKILGYGKFVYFVLLSSCAVLLQVFNVVLLWYYLNILNRDHNTKFHVMVLCLFWMGIFLHAIVTIHLEYQSKMSAIRLKVYLNECIYGKVS